MQKKMYWGISFSTAEQSNITDSSGDVVHANGSDETAIK
jgi:hypothetical protein